MRRFGWREMEPLIVHPSGEKALLLVVLCSLPVREMVPSR